MKTLALFLFAIVAGAAPLEFEAVRKKPYWKDQQGVVSIGDSAVCFVAGAKGAERRCWTYRDIQHLNRVSPTEFSLLSYEDVAWKLGRDRTYRFELTSGELSDALFNEITARIGRPATDRVAGKPAEVERELAVKRLETFGGSEGALYLTPERIVYLAQGEKRSRSWLLARDVESVWSSEPYRLEIHVHEGAAGSFRKPRVYKFALKEPLDAEFYRRLKLRLYEIDRQRDLTP